MLLTAGIAIPLYAQLSFSNPLLDFDTIICVARGARPSEEHLCDQFFGCFASPGGSIYKVTGFKNNNRKVIDILANSTVQNGRYAGRKLSGGSFVSPDLSYDGKTILFAWKPGSSSYVRSWDIDQCFHIFKVNTDGTGLVQLTDGKFNDFDPCFLPNGRIVFISERRGGVGRCHQRRVPTYTLFSMNADGSDIIALSYHETNEWNPSVDNDGMIIYSRWDYVDRDDCIAHHPWVCFPDGRDPRSWHGNYPLSVSTMEDVSTSIPGVGKINGKWPDGRNLRPWAEVDIRAIPNSRKYVATATGHHTQSFGELIIFDQYGIRDDGKMAQIKGITTNRTTWEDKAGPWATCWPLSEEYFLASYNGDIVFLDKSGNRITVCPKSATPVANIGNFKLLDPIPLKPRETPPDIAVKTFDGEREKIPHDPAVISVMNVYNSDIAFPQGTVIKWLRVIQLIPKVNDWINDPPMGAASESVARMALGVVPVESDGSAYFEAPVNRCLMFQVLDSNYMAVQSMRSLTYVHKGEHLSCVGCHEDKWKAAPITNPLALKREPSKLKPEFMEALPTSYYRTAKPVFDAKCVSCHKQQGKGPNMSYNSLKPYIFHFCDGGWPYTNGNISVGEVGGSRTIPGKFGARRSKLYKYLNSSHHNVSLTKDEIHRVTLWLDLNSNEFGSEADTAAQRRGTLVWPTIDVDPKNPIGLEDPRSTNDPSDAYITPGFVYVKPGSVTQFIATAVDMLNQKVEKQPTFTWAVSGGGTISSTGVFTAENSEGGPYTVTATANIGGQQMKFTATVSVSSQPGMPLPAGNLTNLLCLQSTTQLTCMKASDTASIESKYVGTGKIAPLPDEQIQVNGASFKWVEKTNSGGKWFTDCGSNLASYSAITLVSPKERSFKIGYLQDDHVAVWMNGQRVLSDRAYSTKERFSPAITMPSGANSFIIKHTNTGGEGYLSLRFVDEAENDIKDLLYYLKPASTQVHQEVATISAVKAPYSIQNLRTGLQVDGISRNSYRVEIFNVSGQRISSTNGSGEFHFVMPVTSQSSGLFVVRIEIDGKKYMQSVAMTGSR